MLKTLRYVSAAWILGAAFVGWTGGCSSASPSPSQDGGAEGGADGGSDATSPTGDGGSDAATLTYTLIDDMETPGNGPNKLAIPPPLTPAYWFNFGSMAPPAADTFSPALMSFQFSPVNPPTTTLNGKVSTGAAHQACSLTALYDVCGIGVEFAQAISDGGGVDAGGGGNPGTSDASTDGGAEASAAALDAGITDAGAGEAAAPSDAAPPIARVTVPYDISQYKGITFWGRANIEAGVLDVKVAFPDSDTDPRGNVCDNPNVTGTGAGFQGDPSQCYNSYAEHVSFSGNWQQFKIQFSDLVIEQFGWLFPPAYSGTNVYGIDWQAQKNSDVDAGAVVTDFWVDDVYFYE